MTVMGLGLYKEGSGISATRFLLSKGAKVVVTDLKTKEDLKLQIKRLGKLASKIEFVLGHHREKDFKNADMIVKNPGVPRTSKYLQIARKNKIPIETDISLFFKLVNRKQIIGITGTRGKSTTTTLIYDIISQVENNVILGGNITKSPLARLNKMKKDGLAILELSSWMLESLEDPKLSPHISVFTNIYPDHLNTYRDIDDYAAAKENIFLHQNLQDYIILNRDNSYTKKMGSRAPSKRFWFSMKEFRAENGCYLKGKNIYFRIDGKENKILSIKDINVPGKHNIYNVLSAVCACGVYGIGATEIKKAVMKFTGISDRLELIKNTSGVKYYNDTTSTTPEAGIAALTSLGDVKTKKIILIAGGSDKGLDFKPWIKEIKKYCKVLVLLSGTGTDRIKKLIGKNSKIEIIEVDSMADAVGVSKSFAKRRDTILLSPACASFGMFDNEFDRGDQFKEIVNKIKKDS